MLAPGSYHFGPENGRLLLEVTRDGLAGRMGHDLVMEIASWSADATVADDLPASSMVVTADLGSLAVVEGRGGLLPLMERDKREILSTARKLLKSDTQPEMRWTSTGVTIAGSEITATGQLQHGERSTPLQLTIATDGTSATVQAEVRQTALGIRPYQAFLGALRVKDVVAVTARFRLSL